MALLIFSLLHFFGGGEGQKRRQGEKDVPRDFSLHPLMALSFHVPGRDESRQDVTREPLLIPQSECLSFICKQTNKCVSFPHACVYE